MGYILTIVATMIVTAVIVRFIEGAKFTALVYYIVEKGYTEPTKKEMERCIEIVAKKMAQDWFKK